MKKINIPTRFCIICNKPIIRNTKQGEKRISTTQYRKAKFCSVKCKGIWWSKKNRGKNSSSWKGGKQKIICKNCKNEFYVKFTFRKTAKFCSVKCRGNYSKGKHFSSKTEFKKGHNAGDKHPSWKGGRIIDKSGYALIFSSNHPLKTKSKRVREHRLVAEKHLKRYLTKSEVIHHINGIKDDNRPENLYLFSNHSEHRKNEKNKKLKSNIII